MPKTLKVETDEIAVTEDATIIETATKQAKPSKSRNVTPKRVITLILDAARSSTKFLVIDDKGKTIECPKLPSVFAELDNPLHQEEGAYTVGLKNDSVKSEEKAKDDVKHYVVGHRAKVCQKYTSMLESHDNKLKYFYLLALGAISSIPDLYELSTGASEKSRSLTIKMVILSLADGKTLLDQLKRCRWIKVNGTKYRLNFLLNHSLYFAEGYGAAVWAKKSLKFEHEKIGSEKNILVFDIGYGTACSTPYNCAGKFPLKRAVSINGGGGLGSLVDFMLKAMAREQDSNRLIPLSEVRQILEDSKLEDGKIIAIANDGRDVSSAMERAIHWWMTDSVLKFALEDISLEARRHPVILVGGSFAIPPILSRIKNRLIQGGANPEFIVEAPNPGMLAIVGMQALFVEQKHCTLQVVKDGAKEETQLHSSNEIINPDTSDNEPTGDESNLLDTQTA